MRYIFLFLMITIILLPHSVKVEWRSFINPQLDEALNPGISTPASGQVVQGAVIIRGSTSIAGFQSYEVDFAYTTDKSQTWFLIQESTFPIQDGILAVWDTSTISDGDYDLRLLINLTEGNQVEARITHLRVRNYTPIETETPSPTLAQVNLPSDIPTLTATFESTIAPILTSLPLTPNTLPVNPAEISTGEVMLTIGKAAAITVGIFAILGAYLGLRSALHNRR